MAKKIIVKVNFDIGVFDTEEDVEKFIHEIVEIANNKQMVIKDASATLMVICDDPSDLPQEVQDEVKKHRKDDKLDPKKYIN